MTRNDTNKIITKPTTDTSFESNKPLNKSFNNINMGEIKKQAVEYISLGKFIFVNK